MIGALFNPAHYHANAATLGPLLTAAFIGILGLVVFVREPKVRASRAFILMTSTASLWLGAFAAMYSASLEPIAAAWGTIGMTGVVLIPPMVFSFTLIALDLENAYRSLGKWIWRGAIGFLIALLSTDWFMVGVQRHQWGFYTDLSWLGFFNALFLIGVMVLCVVNYWKQTRLNDAGPRAARINALFGAFFLATLGAVDFLPAFGLQVFPFGFILILGFIGLTARAIYRYRLVDITPEFAAGEIINALQDALLVLDDHGTVRVANRYAEKLFGVSHEDLIGSSITDWSRRLSSDHAALERRILTGSLIEQAIHPPEIAGVTAATITATTIRDEDSRSLAIVCLLRDCTQQARSNQALTRHTERQAALYELNIATTATLELNRVVDVLLDRVARLVPKTAATVMLLDETNQWQSVASRGTDDLAWKTFGENLRTAAHAVIERRDAIMVTDLQQSHDGLHAGFFVAHGYRAYLGLPLTANDRPIGVLSFYARESRNFTDDEIYFLRSLAGQAAAAIYNSRLYEESREKTAQLDLANRVKDDFLSVMSHELRTPLNVISGYTKLVQDGIMGEINGEQQKALEKVVRHADELHFMVNSIMNAAKIDAGALMADFDAFNLTAFLDDLRLLYDYPLAKEITLRFDYPADLPVIRSDRDKLKHVLQNLLNNAIKFTHEGSVALKVREITESKQVEFTVRDTGIGIDKKDLPHIFDRFRQVDGSGTRAFGGVGLGLHIVKTFTELLGGRVAVKSTLAAGSQFTVWLPSAANEPQNSHSAAPDLN